MGDKDGKKAKKLKAEKTQASSSQKTGVTSANVTEQQHRQQQQTPQAVVQSVSAAAATTAAPESRVDKKVKHKHKQKSEHNDRPEAQAKPQSPSVSKKTKLQSPDAAALQKGRPAQQQQQQQQKLGTPAEKSTKKRKLRDQDGHQLLPKQRATKRHSTNGSSDRAPDHLTVSIQVPSAAVVDGSKRKKQQAQAQQQQAAAAGPWLVYMAAPDPSVYSKLNFKAYVPQAAAASANSPGMVLVSELEGTTLIGSTKSNIAEPTAQFSSYAVGVYDKQTNTLQLAHPAGGKVVRMEALASQAGPLEVAALSKPAQQSLQQQQLLQVARQGPERDAATRRAEATRLVEAFGSTRRKRQLQARAEGTVVVQQNAAAAELDVLMQEVQARAEAAGDTRQEIMGRMAADRVIPVHNPLATTPQEAYQARLMFGDALMSAVNMGQILHAVDSTEDAEKLKSKVPVYVWHRLQRVCEAGSNQAERKRRARLLALLAALTRLATARPKLVVRPAQPAVEAEGDAAGRPAGPGGLEGLAASLRIGRQQVLELLLEKFYDKRTEDGRVVYVREARQEQLLLMHLLVVALDVEGWRMAPQQFEMLRRELKTTPQDIVTRFRELGCIGSAVRIQVPAEGPGGQETTTGSYHISLLPHGDKSLAQSFPRPKVLKKQAGR